MNPAFSAAHLRTFLPLFQRIGMKASDDLNHSFCHAHPSTQLVEQWKTNLTGTEQANMLVNKWLSRTTLDIIGEGASVY